MTNDYYDSIFISDIHLSTKGCNHKDASDFLSYFYTPKLRILGDFIDLWKLKTVKSWPKEHTAILSGIIQLLQDGTEVEYIIGNHDEFFDNFEGQYENLTIAKEDIIKIGNKRLLLVHGHQFDKAVSLFKWIGVLGSGVHDKFRKRKESTFSLSKYLEKYPKKISKFEKAALKKVRKEKLDGIICGHTHKPNLVIRDGLVYANTGDFVRNSSFIAQEGNKLILMAYENGKPVKVIDLEL